MAQTKAKIAALLFPRYVPLIDNINHNARVGAWIKENKSKVPRFKHKRDLYIYINEKVCNNCPIDFLEFGVYKGGTISLWADINRNVDSRFIGFDSFTGLPEDWTRSHRAGAFDLQGVMPSIDDDRVSFVKGWFQETLRPTLQTFNPRSRLVIHNDSDLYSSTLYALTTLDPWIVPGTVVIFDEFCAALHEFRSFFDYTTAYRRQTTPLAITDDFATQAAFLFS